MDHPAIQQVVTFAMPHPKLGEDVAAAVVLREGQSANEKEIREFAAKRLADFKVPRKILILEEIPKGATGKLQRIGLAQKLGLKKEKEKTDHWIYRVFAGFTKIDFEPSDIRFSCFIPGFINPLTI